MLLNDKQPKEIREALEDCCQDDIKYLRDKQKKAIFNKIIAQTKQELPKKDEIIKEKYIESKEITIFTDEIDKIKTINDQNAEKVAFALLVYCKWLNNLIWFTMSKADIAREAKISNLNSVDQQRVLTGLVQNQYIKSDVRKASRRHCRGTGSNEQQMWSLNYLSKDGDVAFTINDYDNFVYRYLNYVYGGYFVCAGCEKIFKQNKNNTRKYCNNCVRYQPAEFKTIVCIDCGDEFEIDSKDNQTDRCPECYKKYRAEKSREKALRYYRKHK
ncbi:MAG: hypothetical protein WCR36_09620 [Bacteroidaceae bacterium]